MKIYLFEMRSYNHGELTVSEIKVEEKQKVYDSPRGKIYGRRFNKELVGAISGWNNDRCLLLENDPAKACKLFIERKKKEIGELKSKIAEKRSEIEKIKNYLVKIK